MKRHSAAVKALRDLVAMVIRLDPSDERRAAVKRAKRILKSP